MAVTDPARGRLDRELEFYYCSLLWMVCFVFYISLSIFIYYYCSLLWMLCVVFLKKNLNASRPSEHPPVRGKK